jgi:hypothetical protein
MEGVSRYDFFCRQQTLCDHPFYILNFREMENAGSMFICSIFSPLFVFEKITCMKLFDTTPVLTDTATLIMNENIPALEASGIDVNGPFQIATHIVEPPIILALYENKVKVIEWLIAKGAALNAKENPSIVAAAVKCSIKTIEQLLKNGADVNAKNRVGETVMSTVLYNKRYELIPLRTMSMRSSGNCAA